MKVQYLLIFLAAIACNKKEENATTSNKNVEQNCFLVSEGINSDDTKKAYYNPTNDQILERLPKHIIQSQLTNFQHFNYDKKTTEALILKEKEYFESSEYKKQFSEWISILPEFNYLSVNENFALAKNKYGLWIVEKTETDYKPYFLGFTQDFYLTDFYAKNQTFIRNNQVVLSGTLVNKTRLSRVPMLPKYEVIKDGLEFSINIDDVQKDSDNDGYNDLFEIFVGLNPNAKDTDKDGINDFEDSNPKYKSAESEFTAMYEAIADEPAKSEKYSFTEILTDCDYFQNINPKNRKILIYNTEEQHPIKYDVLDNFFTRKYGKIGTSKFYPDVYLIDFSDEVGNGTFSAELINNQWKVGKKYTITFGM